MRSVQWTHEITPEAVPALQQQLEWALQRQNRRFSDQFEQRRRIPLALRRRLLVVLGVLVVALVVALARLDPWIARRHVGFFAFAAGAGVLAIVVGFALPGIQARSRRFAGRMIARRAEMMMRPLAAKAPFPIAYELTDELLRARAVLSTPDAVFVFAHDRSLRLQQAIYGAAERDRVVAAFVAAGASHEHLDRPVDGYVAPIPEAVIRSR